MRRFAAALPFFSLPRGAEVRERVEERRLEAFLDEDFRFDFFRAVLVRFRERVDEPRKSICVATVAWPSIPGGTIPRCVAI